MSPHRAFCTNPSVETYKRYDDSHAILLPEQYMNTPAQLHIPQPVALICRTLRDAGYESYMVGGCVRDQLMGLCPRDYDITTNCHPEEILRIFKERQFNVIPVGLMYGTIAVHINNANYEITTYRAETHYEDGRHPQAVHFIADLKGDLSRRDLTINAIAYDPVNDHVVDLFGGRADIAHKIIRAVGDPDGRFGEDYLRLMRAIRYAARFGYSIEQSTGVAIKTHASQITRISSERILAELCKMAGETGDIFADGVVLLKEYGILKHILPEIDVMDGYAHSPDTHPEGGVWEHTVAALRQNNRNDVVVNLAILFHDVGKPSSFRQVEGKIRYYCHHQTGHDVLSTIAQRLKMSGQLKDALQFSTFHHMKFHALLEMSNHKLLQLIESPHWPVLYQVAWCDDAARGPVNVDRWRAIDERIARLHETFIAQHKLAAIRAVANGTFVMRVKNIPPGPKVGQYIEKTVAWALNNAVDAEEQEKMEAFLKDITL